MNPKSEIGSRSSVSPHTMERIRSIQRRKTYEKDINIKAGRISSARTHGIALLKLAKKLSFDVFSL